jgi:hypothetical protein
MGAATLAVVSLIGAGISARGQQQAGKYANAVAQQNARFADQAASDAIRRGREEAAIHRSRVRQVIGSQKAGFAAAGVETESGSALDVLSDTALLGELDALTIENNAAREAWGLRTQGFNYLAQGRLARLQGRYGAAGTAISGAAGAVGTYYGAGGTFGKK